MTRSRPNGNGRAKKPRVARARAGASTLDSDALDATGTGATSEWLEVDGLGGFASGTASGVRTRRYHALLLSAEQPPAGRVALVNGLEAWVETPSGTHGLTTQRYAPDVLHPRGDRLLASFTCDPWPRWTWALDDGTRIAMELFVPHERPVVVMRWEHLSGQEAKLHVRPLLSGRDPHALMRENSSLRFDAEVQGDLVTWRPYDGVPAVTARSNGAYAHAPEWYRNFLYAEEQARGLDCIEDLAAPGSFTWSLDAGAAVLMLGAGAAGAEALGDRDDGVSLASRFEAAERVRRGGMSPLERAADAYLVRRGTGRTVIAGYPWFGDWGRDTFIALRGLCTATGRLEDARRILVEWAGAVSEGMLPNRFPDQGDTPEYNSVDASLWYIIAAYELLQAHRRMRKADRQALIAASLAILDGYANGTRYGIRMDTDGLLACGEAGVQLTWMDAKVGDWVVTPRTGKPVEIQALWINVLTIGAKHEARWAKPLAKAKAAFLRRFNDPARGALYDVVDVDHVAGAVDASIRPNQLFAVAGLPFPLVEGEAARRIVDEVERLLWTPLGPRSLAPGDPRYAAHYRGGVRDRDGSYHQGTVWPWLAGAFVEAWVRVRGGSPGAIDEARARFVEPLLAHLGDAGLGHVSEIADAEAPHAPRGCPFQAWSVGELLRLEHGVLATKRRAARKAQRTAARVA